MAPNLWENDSLGTLRASFPRRVVLDVKTLLWTLQPVYRTWGPAVPGQRRLLYQVRARLLRTENGKIIWEGHCSTGQDQSTGRSWDDLTANGGALLKARLDEIAEACGELLRAQMLTGDKKMMVK